jgi:hypothetical protein
MAGPANLATPTPNTIHILNSHPADACIYLYKWFPIQEGLHFYPGLGELYSSSKTIAQVSHVGRLLPLKVGTLSAP